MTSKCTIFADHVGSSKIFVHVNDDEMDTIPVYEEVFSSDEEDEHDENEGMYYYVITSHNLWRGLWRKNWNISRSKYLSKLNLWRNKLKFQAALTS